MSFGPGRAARCASLAVLAVAVTMLWTPIPQAHAYRTIECQHPVMTGVEVFNLHHVTPSRACPVALALFRWDDTESHETKLYGCHGMLHPYLRTHTFDGWRLSLVPELEMSRGNASFDVIGTDFPINCT